MNKDPRKEEKVDRFAVQYEQTAVTLARQFILSASEEEVLLDCSSGLITGENGEQLLPIHSRLAMPWSAARRLIDLLNQVVGQEDLRGHNSSNDKNALANDASEESPRTAKLPRMESING